MPRDDVIQDRLILCKDTSVSPPSTTVRFADWTPHGMYEVLTDAVLRELAEYDMDLEDSEFKDGERLGKATVNAERNEVLNLELRCVEHVSAADGGAV